MTLERIRPCPNTEPTKRAGELYTGTATTRPAGARPLILYSNINLYREALDVNSGAIRTNPYIPEAWPNGGSLCESCYHQVGIAIEVDARFMGLGRRNAVTNKD